MRVVALLRVSTENQAESRLGLEAQRAQIVAYCQRSGLRVEHWVEETASGGADMADRPGLLDALTLAAELGRGAALVVSSHDRLARSVLVAELTIQTLGRTGAVLLSADGAGNADTAEAELMRRILQAMSAYERARIALRTRAALRAKKARGEQVGGSKAFGLRASESALAARLQQLADAGVAPDRIAAQLTHEGYTGRRQAPITHSWVRRRLHQRR